MISAPRYKKQNNLLYIFLSTLMMVCTATYPQDTTALKQKLATTKSDTVKVKLLNQLCNLIENSNPNNALKYAEEAFEIANKTAYIDGQANALINMAALQMYLGQSELALKSNQLLYQLCKKKGDKIGMVSSLNNIGGVYQRISKYTEAAKYLFEALKTAEEIKDEELIAVCQSNLATLFVQQGDFEKAIKYATKAQIIYKRVRKPANEAKNLEILGNCYAFNGNPTKAIPYYLQALKIYESLGNDMGTAVMYTQMVDCYADNPVKQIEYLRKAQLIWGRIAPNHMNAVANTGNFGYTLFQILQNEQKLQAVQKYFGFTKKQMLVDADRYFKAGIDLSKKIGQTELLSMFTIEYAKLCEYRGDYKAALTNLKSHYQVKDSLYSQENKNQIATLEAQFAFQKKEERYKTAQQLAKLKTNQAYLYGGIVVILISSILLYFLNRFRINQLRLKNELIRKEAEQKTEELQHQYQLSESELKAIRSQMNPHFIFNVLNSIEAFILENDKRTASRLIQKFASLSRLILENSTKSLVTADKEWKALMLYTELEAMRYAGQFTYHFDVDESIELKTLYLPPMLIQPLIENAILHGLIQNNKTDGRLTVSLKKTGDGICVTVQDNGAGLKHQGSSNRIAGIKEKSMGLASILERIQMIEKQSSNGHASFSIQAAPDQPGTIALVCLPIFQEI